MLAPSWCRRFLSYMTGMPFMMHMHALRGLMVLGWLILSGWQAFVASGCVLTATMIQGLIVIVHPTYESHPWHSVLLYWAVLLFAVFVNTTLAGLLPKLEGLILILHLAGFFAILVPLATLSHHNSASEVFDQFLNEGNWSTQGLSFMVGLLGNVFAFFGTSA